jgi:co-chaperonin GroES (HSP10)
MKISSMYITVEKIEEAPKEGFQAVEIQDSSVYRGRVTNLPEIPVHVDNTALLLGDTVLFAKYSPDTHEVELEGKKVKFIKVSDILAVL